MIRILASFIGAFFFISTATAADNQPEGEATTAATAIQAEARGHKTLDTILKGLVFKGEWVIETAKANPPQTGTRIRRGDKIQKGLDINYIPYKMVKTRFKDFILVLAYYISDMQKANLAGLTDNERLAYWLNVRTALVLEALLEAHPVKGQNLEDLVLGARWDEPSFVMDRKSYSINEIEALIKTNWTDPLVIYGFFSGARQGPFIMNEAFLGDTVYTQLEANARTYLNASKTISFSRKRGMRVPTIFDWHSDLFTATGADLRDHILGFANPKLEKQMTKNASYSISYDFDWKLNDLPSHLARQFQDTIFAYHFGGDCTGVQTSEGCDAGARINFNAFHAGFFKSSPQQ